MPRLSLMHMQHTYTNHLRPRLLTGNDHGFWNFTYRRSGVSRVERFSAPMLVQQQNVINTTSLFSPSVTSVDTHGSTSFSGGDLRFFLHYSLNCVFCGVYTRSRIVR